MECGAAVNSLNSTQHVTAPARSDRSTGRDVLYAAIASVVIIAGFLFFVFSGGEEDGTTKGKNTAKKEVSLAFKDDKYALSVRCAEDMNGYLRRKNIEKKEIEWTADSSKVQVGSNGIVAIQDYNVSTTLTAKSRKNNNIVATCEITSLSEKEDFQNKVADYNQVRTQDKKQKDGTVSVCNKNSVESHIKVTEHNYKPSTQIKGKYWDSNLFYSLEEVEGRNTGGKINNYKINRKQFVNDSTGNVMEYEVYQNPRNGTINKIVSIEHADTYLNITEYYYTDKGKLNFVLAYRDSNYLPNYANVSIHGERYLFDKDTMVTWRIVKTNTQNINYCRTQKEKKRLRDNGWTSVKLYSSLSRQKKKKYDALENKILNAAYNTLNKMKNYEGISTIRGRVNDERENALGDVGVDLYSDTYDCKLYSGKTNQNGYYEIFVPSREGSYWMQYETDDGEASEKSYNIKLDTDDLGVDQDTIYLTKEKEQRQYQFQFLDATKSRESTEAVVYGAQINFRRGSNNYNGEVVTSLVTGGYAGSVAPSLTSGMYTVESKCDGFMTEYRNVFLSSQSEETYTILMTPQLNRGEIRIVLDWGAYPQDEDSHLFTPSGEQICYYSPEIAEGNLDVDDTDGYGPETVTIKNVENGEYKYYVADYTHCSTDEVRSTALSESGATVRVYTENGLEKTFYVPKEQEGVIWEVFSIRNKKIVPIQRYYASIEDKSWCRKSTTSSFY